MHPRKQVVDLSMSKRLSTIKEVEYKAIPKKSLKMIQLNWVIILIIVISTFSFITGFLQTNFASESEDLQNLTVDMEDKLSRMEASRNFFVQFDIDKNNLAQQLLAQIHARVIEYELKNGSLSAIDRDVQRNIIMTGFQLVFTNLNDTFAANIQSAFEFQSAAAIQFASEAVDGFNYLILRSNWEENPPATFLTIDEYLLDLGFTELIVEDLESIFGGSYSFNGIVPSLVIPNIYSMHDSVIIDFQNQINIVAGSATRNQNTASTLAIAVSLATIATVLASAMANSVADRQNLKAMRVLRQEVLNAEEEKEFPRPKIEIFIKLGLLIAFTLSFIGFLYATYFFFALN